MDLYPRANPRVVLRRELDDWAVLFDPDSGRGFGLDPVGIFLWERLDGRRSPADLLAELRQGFAEVPPEADQQVATFLQHLGERGLLAP